MPVLGQCNSERSPISAAPLGIPPLSQQPTGLLELLKTNHLLRLRIAGLEATVDLMDS